MQIDALRAHLQENLNLYGSQNLVNLVNHKGHEKPVKEAFEKYMNEVRGIYDDLFLTSQTVIAGKHAEDKV